MRFHVIYAALAISALAAIRISNAGEAGCSAAASDGGNSCGCCPKCGCHEAMIPVCHTYCEMKKTTKYHYCCQCEAICTACGHCKSCDGGCDKCGDGCNGGCGCNDGCGNEENKCNCHIYSAHKLVKTPYTVETPVMKCKVEWVCPRCGCNCGCSEKTDSAPAPGGPMSAPPAIPGKSASVSPMDPAVARY